MKKNNLFLTLFFIVLSSAIFDTVQANGNNNPKSWLTLIADSLLYGTESAKQFLSSIHSKSAQGLEFANLPPEEQQTIIFLLSEHSNTSTLESSARTINALAQVNKQLHALINGPIFCLKIVKHLAQQFNCSDETAALALQTKEAKNRLTIQKKFENLFAEKFFMIEEFYNLYDSYKDYIDLNFTYRHSNNFPYDEKNTPLITAILYPSPYKTNKIKSLLETHKVNINYQNTHKQTALILCAYNNDNPAVLKLLCDAPHIRIDLQDEHNNTALLATCLSKRNTQKLICILLLLKAGADPEKANTKGETPLLILNDIGTQQEIKAIQNAIHKKHNKTKRRRSTK